MPIINNILTYTEGVPDWTNEYLIMVYSLKIVGKPGEIIATD